MTETTYDLAAEKSILGHCLIRPEIITEVASRVRPMDIIDPFHRQVLEILIAMAEEGRKPSVEAVASILGDEEVKAGFTVRKYLMAVANETLMGSFLPWGDAAEVVVDHSRRRQLADVGLNLTRGAGLALSIRDLTKQNIEALDAVLAGIRTEKLFSYSAARAGKAALEHIDSKDRPHPTTGLVDLDRTIGGWPLGELSVVAGRPGAGKSAIAISALLRTAKAGNATLLFSLEMTREQLGARMLTDLAYTAADPLLYEDILNRRIGPDAGRARARLGTAQEQLDALPISIEEERGLTVSQIMSRSRKAAANLQDKGLPLRAIFIDHMMLVQASDRYSGNRVREIGEISEGLTLLAQELDVAVVALCQLNRSVEGRDNKRPTLSDLRDSGEVEQNASTVTFLYRPAYYLEQTKFDDLDTENERLRKLEEQRNVLELIVSKNRNGRVGVVNAFVDIGANAIRNAAFKPKIVRSVPT